MIDVAENCKTDNKLPTIEQLLFWVLGKKQKRKVEPRRQLPTLVLRSPWQN